MDATTFDRYDDDNTGGDLTQRRLFAAMVAANNLRGECDLLREVVILAEQAWLSASARLVAVEALRNEFAKSLEDV